MTNLKTLFQELENGFHYGLPTVLSSKLDQLHSEKYTLLIEDFIKVNNTTETEFIISAIPFKGLDLIYSDYTNN